MKYINPDKLLPDRNGDYLVLVDGEYEGKPAPAPTVSRFNKRLLASYWSIEAICKQKVIGWKPLLCDTIKED